MPEADLTAKRAYYRGSGVRFVFDADELQALVPQEVWEEGRAQAVFDWLYTWFRDTAGKYCPGRFFAGSRTGAGRRKAEYGFTCGSYAQAWCTCERKPGYLRQDQQAACQCEAPGALAFAALTPDELQARETERVRRATESWAEVTGRVAS